MQQRWNVVDGRCSSRWNVVECKCSKGETAVWQVCCSEFDFAQMMMRIVHVMQMFCICVTKCVSHRGVSQRILLLVVVWAPRVGGVGGQLIVGGGLLCIPDICTDAKDGVCGRIQRKKVHITLFQGTFWFVMGVFQCFDPQIEVKNFESLKFVNVKNNKYQVCFYDDQKGSPGGDQSGSCKHLSPRFAPSALSSEGKTLYLTYFQTLFTCIFS